MHATDLIARHIPSPGYPSDPAEGICCITGKITPCVLKKDLIGPSFTDWSLCAAPSSPHVGLNVYASWLHGHRAPGKKKDFCPERNACWFVSENEFRQISKDDIRRLVLEGSPDTPWAGWVTTSYKKHGSLRTPVNFHRYGIWGFDDTRIDCSDPDLVLDWWQRLIRYQASGIGRTSMMSGEAPPGVIKCIGLSVWTDFVHWVNDKKGAPLLLFLVYLLPSKRKQQ